MSNAEIFFLSLFSALIMGGIGFALGSIIKKKKAGFWLGALLGPIGFIILFLLPRDKAEHAPAENATEKQIPDNPPCERDLKIDSYKIWLTDKYKIERHETLGKFVCNDKLFEDINSALTFADNLEKEKIKAHVKEEQKKQENLKKEYEEKQLEKERREKELQKKQAQLKKNLRWIVPLFLFLCGGFIWHQISLNKNYEYLNKLHNEKISEQEEILKEKNSELEKIVSQIYDLTDKISRAVSEKADELKDSQIKKVQFELVRSNDYGENGYYLKVKNNSKFFLDNIDVVLNVYSNGVLLPKTFKASSEYNTAKDKYGNSMNYWIAPRESKIIKDSIDYKKIIINDYDILIETPFDKKFASDNKVKKTKYIFDDYRYVLDRSAKYNSGSINFVEKPTKQESGSIIYFKKPVYFSSIARDIIKWIPETEEQIEYLRTTRKDLVQVIEETKSMLKDLNNKIPVKTLWKVHYNE